MAFSKFLSCLSACAVSAVTLILVSATYALLDCFLISLASQL
jgi:hypothetical protein